MVMLYFWFGVVGENDEHYGEEFIVGASCSLSAKEIAKHLFPGEKLKLYDEMPGWEAEIMGLDIY